MKNTNSSTQNKGFSFVEVVVVIAIVVVLLAVLAPSLLRYTEASRMQKDESAMDEVCNVVQLAMADSEIFDEVYSYSIPNNYVTYTDSSGVYATQTTDEEFWAPDGSGHAVTITWNPDENGNYIISEGLVNDMTYGNGSVADSRTADDLQQCYLHEMGLGKLSTQMQQNLGTTFSEKSATYANSSYTVFIRFEAVDGIKRADVYGSFNGTNLTPDCPASLGSGTSSYTEEEEPEQTKTGGTTQSNYSNSDLQGSGGGGAVPTLPSYKQCTHEHWEASGTNEEVHICTQCRKEEAHEYVETSTGTPSCTEDSEITKTCTVCNNEKTEIKEAGHTFDNSSDLTCNVCNTRFQAYHFRPSDYDSKMRTTTATDAVVVIPGTFKYGNTHYKTVTLAEMAFKNNTYVEEVVVPDTVGDFLYPSVFAGCGNLKKIRLPDSITTIRSNMFDLCTSLTSINFPKNLQSIQSSAFYGCDGLVNIDLTHCTNLTTIGKAVFIYSDNIQKVSLPGSVTTIGDSAFMDCKSLTDVVFDANSQLQSIGYQCFFRCYALKNVNIPTSLITLGGRAFANCRELDNITFGNNLTIIEEQAFINCTTLKSIVIPDSVKTIKWSAFEGCSALDYADLGNGVETIGSRILFGTAIKEITVPDTVNTVGQCAFASCPQLSVVNLPEKAIDFDSYIFDSCTALETITISGELEEICFGFFNKCTSLTSIIFTGTVEQWNALPLSDWWNRNVPATHVQCSDGQVAI